LLARPLLAGPDGSSHQFSESFEQNPVAIDWDNPDSVSLIVDEVQQRLEGALRSTMTRGTTTDLPSNNNGHHNGKEEDEAPSSSQRFIRQITITTGRGFYTFCSGKTAPFLKVEYYDPSHRWRVKIMLEKGLELPLEYHPPNRKK